jgi:phosphoglycerate dehydrogenase-like enzyme
VKAPTIALAFPDEILARAIADGGGVVVPVGAEAEALMWNGFHDPVGLAQALRAAPSLRWVQLPSAGVDDFVAAGLLKPTITWTSAKGAYAEPVAEHALTLALSLLRVIPARSRALSWGPQLGSSLHRRSVVIVGAGGVAKEFLRITAPFELRTTVVRRDTTPVAGAGRTVPFEKLHEVLPEADLVLLAAALTDQTTGIIGAPELALMSRDAILVNVARGGLVDTDALVRTLTARGIAGAGLDVTVPEPLPDGHPLWDLDTVLITPHSADTADMVRPLLAARLKENVALYAAGRDLVGAVDLALGY